MEQQQLAERFFTVIGEMRRYLMQTKPSPGVTPGEMTILHLIDICDKRGERASTTWLSGRIKMSKSSVSQVLKAMEGKGWIARSLDPENRRQTNIELTDEGRRKMDELYKVMIASIARVLELMGRENAEEFLELTELFLARAKIEFQRKE